MTDRLEQEIGQTRNFTFSNTLDSETRKYVTREARRRAIALRCAINSALIEAQEAESWFKLRLQEYEEDTKSQAAMEGDA